MYNTNANFILLFQVNGLISNVDYAGAKFTMLLFINHRLVDSTPLKVYQHHILCISYFYSIYFLKRALDSVYATYLAKGKHPFVYLSIEIAPNCVDVNVHPTKHEVHFLNEDAIIHKIQSTADMLLKNASTSRSFAIQVKKQILLFINWSFPLCRVFYRLLFRRVIFLTSRRAESIMPTLPKFTINNLLEPTVKNRKSINFLINQQPLRNSCCRH
jgi:hypothetical protein